MQKLNIYVVGGSYGYACWLNHDLVKTIAEADLVFFTGGEDVFEGLYNEPRGSHTYHGVIQEAYGMPRRDYIEKLAYNEAIALGKPMFGTCRGIQFLTAMNGGKLVQDVNHHGWSNHPILWDDGDITDTTTVHHQMCSPFNLDQSDYRILAIAHPALSTHYLDGNDEEMEMPCEPEVLYFPKTKCLGAQGHPEMYSKPYNTTFHKKLRHAIQTLLLKHETTRTTVN